MSKTTIDRLYETHAPTVIPSHGARHIDNTDGFTACGIAYDETASHSLGSQDRRQRISCGFCATGTTYPKNVKAV